MKGNGLPNEIEALQDRVETLEKRTSDLALKGRIVGSLFGKTGLDIFFGEPEFWENPYDSGQADCARRCIEDLTERRKACEAMTDSAERQACYQSAVNDAALCQSRCSQAFPRPIG
jgi:hypothetical protein